MPDPRHPDAALPLPPHHGLRARTRYRRPERLVRRLTQLVVGLFVLGLGVAMLVRSDLGPASWDVLALGIAEHLPLSFGTATLIVSGCVLLCWIPLRERPGFGTVLNALAIGPSADVGLWMFPATDALPARVAYLAGGILLIGFATGTYLGARFGPGPRDGLMTGLHRVTRWPIWVVRTLIEVTAVVIGVLLGGLAGIGTVLFAFLIGPMVQLFLPRLTVRLSTDPSPGDARTDDPEGPAAGR